MKIEDVFEEIFTGFNINNSTSKEEVDDLYFINKDSIQYTNIINEKLINKKSTSLIKKKYFIQGRDIIISLKKPYKVGTYKFLSDKKIVIPNNFIILRGINRDLYSYIFVSNYLEKIGIDKYTKKNNIGNNDLTVADIKNIELPKIKKEDQMKISTLLNKINERSAIYSSILDNDDEIIKYALNLIVGENDAK